MIDRKTIALLSLTSLLLALCGAPLVWILHSSAMAVGVVLGAVVGVAPFLSWAWILRQGRPRLLASLFFLAKFALYGAAFYLLVTRGLASPFGVFLGLTAAIVVQLVGAFVLLSPERSVA